MDDNKWWSFSLMLIFTAFFTIVYDGTKGNILLWIIYLNSKRKEGPSDFDNICNTIGIICIIINVVLSFIFAGL